MNDRVFYPIVGTCIVMVIAIATAGLFGCYNQKPVEGLITAKKFEPEHTELVMLPVVSTDANGNTTTTIQQFWFFEPDRYVLTIEPYDKDGNALKPVKVMVNQAVFDAVEEGTWFKSEPDKLDTRKARKRSQR